jgi:Spy/CpxP family protein refolding chaperone
MKGNLFKYILVLSLLLNFSLLGAAGFTYYQQTRYRAVPYGHPVQGRAPVCSSIHPYLFEALALKPAQREQFEQKAPSFHEALDKKGAEINRLRGSLFELMRADQPDTQAIDATIAEINRIQRDMQKLIVAHMLEFKSMLDKGQQKRFFDLIQGAMRGRGQEIGCF